MFVNGQKLCEFQCYNVNGNHHQVYKIKEPSSKRLWIDNMQSNRNCILLSVCKIENQWINFGANSPLMVVKSAIVHGNWWCFSMNSWIFENIRNKSDESLFCKLRCWILNFEPSSHNCTKKSMLNFASLTNFSKEYKVTL